MKPHNRPWDREYYPGAEDKILLALIAEMKQVTIGQLEQRTGLLPEILRVRLARLYHSALINKDGSFFVIALDGKRALHLPVEEDRRKPEEVE